MEENLESNNQVNNEISDNTNKSNSEAIKAPKSEITNMNENKCKSEDNPAILDCIFFCAILGPIFSSLVRLCITLTLSSIGQSCSFNTSKSF